MNSNSFNQLPVFVVNLERSPARRQSMELQLQGLGIAYEIFPAVDGMRLSEDQRTKYSEVEAMRALGRPLVKTQIGCALSHINIYEKIVSEGIPECVVLEDDIFIGKMFKSVLEMRSRLPKDWDLVNFCTDARQLPFGEALTDIYRASSYLEPANRTSAYLINLRGAKKLLDVAYPIRYEADGLTGRPHLSGLVSYGVSPAIVALQDVESDIWLPLSTENTAPRGIRRFLKKLGHSIAKRF